MIETLPATVYASYLGHTVHPISGTLRPSKTKPSPLRWLLLLLLPLRLLARHGSLERLGRSLRCLSGVVDVVPGNVKEDGLDGDEDELGRELDNIAQIHAADGILAELLDEGCLPDGWGVLLALLAEVIDVHDGPVALELAGEKVRKELDVVPVDIYVEGSAGLASDVGEL